MKSNDFFRIGVLVLLLTMFFPGCSLNERQEIKKVYYRAPTEISDGIILVSENKQDFYSGWGLSFSILRCNVADNSIETLYTPLDTTFFKYPKRFFLIHDSVFFTTYDASFYIKGKNEIEEIYDFNMLSVDSSGSVVYFAEDSVLYVMDRLSNVKDDVLEARGKIFSVEIIDGEYFLHTSEGVEYFGNTTRFLHIWYDFYADDYYFGEFHSESLNLTGVHNLNCIKTDDKVVLEIYCSVTDTHYINNEGILKIYADSWTDSGAVFDRTVKGKRMINTRRFLYSSDPDDYGIPEGSVFVTDSFMNIYFSLEEYYE